MLRLLWRWSVLLLGFLRWRSVLLLWLWSLLLRDLGMILFYGIYFAKESSKYLVFGFWCVLTISSYSPMIFIFKRFFFILRKRVNVDVSK